MNQPVTTLILGPSGSGKTVFLASMYAYLNHECKQTGFFFKAQKEQADKLREVFYGISDTDRAEVDVWPHGTAGQVEYLMELQGYAEGGGKTVGKVRYLDYAGGWISHEATRPPSFDEDVRTANVVVFLLDGKVLMDAMEGNVKRLQRYLGDLSRLARDIEKIENVQFVITKFDYLEAKGVSLSDVRSFLDQEEDWVKIIDLFKDRPSKLNIRLIPVSAVGQQFCHWDGQKFVRNAEARLKPENLDLPFALALGQMFKQKAELEEKKANLQIKIKKTEQRERRWWEMAAEWGSKALDMIGDAMDHVIPGPPAAKPVVRMLLGGLFSMGNSAAKDAEFEAQRAAAIASLEGEAKYHAALVTRVLKNAMLFEQKYPECKILGD